MGWAGQGPSAWASLPSSGPQFLLEATNTWPRWLQRASPPKADGMASVNLGQVQGTPVWRARRLTGILVTSVSGINAQTCLQSPNFNSASDPE